jgi:hypothetical protein
MAIVFKYLYRDGGNFKNWGDVCLKNEQCLSVEEIDALIRECLIDGMYFTAEKVGLPTLYFDEHNEQLDHEWHEYDRVREGSLEGDEATRDIKELIGLLLKSK